MRFFLEIIFTVLLLVCVIGQERANPCIVDQTGQVGLCLHISNCPVVLEAAYRGIPPQTCSFMGTVAVVCCPRVFVLEGSNCTITGTGRVGICTPFANCRSAMLAASKGVLPQTCPVRGTSRIVCCEDVRTVVEGDSCTKEDTGSTGVCRPFSNCQTAKLATNTGIFPQKCNTTNNLSDLVCCEEPACAPLPRGVVTQLPIGSKAADYCIDLAEEIYPCLQTSLGSTRGNLCQIAPASNVEYNMAPLTTSDEAPHYGRIGMGDKDDISWQGAPVSLVSDRWVVSAASAVLYIGVGSVKFVGLGGSFTLRKYTPDAIYFVSTIVIHPEYNASISRSYNDIALLQLEQRITFTSRIMPACLHTGTLLPYSDLIHAGGDGGYAHPDSKTTMRIASQNECSRRFPDKRYHPNGVKHSLQICGFPIKTSVRCGTWSSGSPLYIYNGPRVSCTNLLVGISSTWVQAPCSFIFTRISAYIPWLESSIWP